MPVREYLTISAQMGLYAIAGMIALVSGVAFFPIAAFALLSLFSLASEPSIATASLSVWSMVASYTAVRIAVAFIDLLGEFDPKRWTLAALWGSAVVAACPLWWR